LPPNVHVDFAAVRELLELGVHPVEPGHHHADVPEEHCHEDEAHHSAQDFEHELDGLAGPRQKKKILLKNYFFLKKYLID
jgi:hypothetical protein